MLRVALFVLAAICLSACRAEPPAPAEAAADEIASRDSVDAPVAAEPEPAAPAVDVLVEPLRGPMLTALESYVDRRLAEMGTSRKATTVRHVALDLSVPEPDWDMQGSLDVVVVYEGRDVCGSGGCTMDIATFSVDAEAFLNSGIVGLVKTPIRVAESVSSNRHDLLVHVGGGGIEPFESLLRMDLRGDSQYPDKAERGVRATQAQIDAAQVVLF